MSSQAVFVHNANHCLPPKEEAKAASSSMGEPKKKYDNDSSSGDSDLEDGEEDSHHGDKDGPLDILFCILSMLTVRTLWYHMIHAPTLFVF